MRPIRWLALGSLLVFTIAVYTSPTAAQLSDTPSGPPNFVLEWRTGNPSMPWGIVAGENDLVYVALYQNSVVQIFTRDGELVNTIGAQGSLPGEFLGPVGLALGPEGNLYVADSENSRVQVFTPEGEYIRDFTHPEAFEVRFKPWGIAVDRSGNVYVSVLNTHDIHKFDPTGNLLFTFGGFGPNPGQFVGPTGMAISDDNELYIVDSLAFRIQVFNLQGEVQRTWGTLCDIYFTPGRGCVDPDGSGPLESGDGQFSSPWGVALDDQGRVYVADSANKRVQLFTSEGEFITKWGELGSEAGNFDNNVGITVGPSGNIFVSDLNNNRVQRFRFPNAEQPEDEPMDEEDEEENGDESQGDNGGEPPLVLNVSLPDQNQVGEAVQQATVNFTDVNGDLARGELRVIDGKSDPLFLDLSDMAGIEEGDFKFDYNCPIPQQLVLKLTLIDELNHRSEPRRVDIFCGEPLIGNFNDELENVDSTNTTLRFNLLILDDDITELSEGSVFTDESTAVGIASDGLRLAVENQIVPAITGIWDQCGVKFELAEMAVVRPEFVSLTESTLDAELFFRDGPLPEIALSEPARTRPLQLLEDSLSQIHVDAEDIGINIDTDLLTVFISGARIVSRAGDDVHFGGVTTLNGKVSLIRWDSVFITDSENGELILPTRIITAIAHEFGHNFGLIHSNDEDIESIANDPLNLMLSVPERPTAVPPQPTANLVEAQCEQAEPFVAQLRTLDSSIIFD